MRRGSAPAEPTQSVTKIESSSRAVSLRRFQRLETSAEFFISFSCVQSVGEIAHTVKQEAEKETAVRGYVVHRRIQSRRVNFSGGNIL